MKIIYLITSALILFSTQNSMAIINGNFDRKNKFTSTVRLIFGDNKTCSGTLVSRDTIITAAHCLVSHILTDKIIVRSGFKAVITDKQKNNHIFELTDPNLDNIHPDYKYLNEKTEQGVFVENKFVDLAYIRFKNKLPESLDVEYAKINIGRNHGAKNFISGFGKLENERSTCVGRFCFSKNKAGHEATKLRNFAKVEIDIMGDEYDIYLATSGKSFISSLFGRPQSSNGDSGGSLYDSEKNLVGVIVAGLRSESLYINIYGLNYTATATIESYFLSFTNESNADFLREIQLLDRDIEIIDKN